jgi:hypothetical protein
VKNLGEKGLTVLGITKFYKNGFLPKGRSELEKHGVKDGESVKDMDETSYLKHLEAFRERMEVPFPSVVATDEDFAAYKVRGIPTNVVVDPEGRIAFIAIGGMREHLLRISIERLLPKK